jgi:hypothetical protein
MVLIDKSMLGRSRRCAFMTCIVSAYAEHGVGNVAAARALAAAARDNAEPISAVPTAALMLSRLDAELAVSSEQPGQRASTQTMSAYASSASQP